MKMADFKDLFFKNIAVTLKSGETVTGLLTGVENDFDTSSGKDEIELAIGEDDLSLEIDEIESVEELVSND